VTDPGPEFWARQARQLMVINAIQELIREEPDRYIGLSANGSAQVSVHVVDPSVRRDPRLAGLLEDARTAGIELTLVEGARSLRMLDGIMSEILRLEGPDRPGVGTEFGVDPVTATVRIRVPAAGRPDAVRSRFAHHGDAVVVEVIEPRVLGPDDFLPPTTYLPDPAVLAAWDGFPADARPRPVVITAPPQFPPRGFVDGAAKMAAMAGRYELAVAFPADPPDALSVVLPDGPADLPSRTAREAFGVLTADGTQGPGPSLTITAVELGVATFPSDRGPLALPAWLFTGPGVIGPISVPAVAESAFWPRTPHALVMSGDARLAADGLTLTIVLPLPDRAFSGEPRFRVEPEWLESDSAVVVGVRAIPDGIEPDVPGSEWGGGQMQEFTITLGAPLGGRVLLAPVVPTYFEVFASVAPP